VTHPSITAAPLTQAQMAQTAHLFHDVSIVGAIVLGFFLLAYVECAAARWWKAWRYRRLDRLGR
jgi:hypothetical protein